MSSDIVAVGEDAEMTSLKPTLGEPNSSAVAAPVGMTAVDFRVLGSQTEKEGAVLPPPPLDERLGSADLPFNLGAYTLEARLGEGAMASVYVARHRLLGHHCAVKLLRPEYEADPRVRERFLREGRVLASLQHTNLVRVHDLVEPDKAEPGYLVMELLQGETLEDRIGRGRLSLVDALDYATQMASGLMVVHGTGVAHRDLKPANIFLAMDAEGRESIKILDFGIAKGLAGTATHGTRPGALIGTPAYMAPEQVLGEEVDHRVDIYQLGLVMWEMLCGNLPCEDRTLPEILLWHTTQQVVDLPADVPREVSEIVQGCLQIERAKRWPDMRELRCRLDRAPRLGLPSGESLDGLPAFLRDKAAARVRSTPDEMSYEETQDAVGHREFTSKFHVASSSWMVFSLSLVGFLAAVGAAGWLAISPSVLPLTDKVVVTKYRPVFKNLRFAVKDVEPYPVRKAKSRPSVPPLGIHIAKNEPAPPSARPLPATPSPTPAALPTPAASPTPTPDDGRAVPRSTTKSPF